MHTFCCVKQYHFSAILIIALPSRLYLDTVHDQIVSQMLSLELVCMLSRTRSCPIHDLRCALIAVLMITSMFVLPLLYYHVELAQTGSALFWSQVLPCTCSHWAGCGKYL